MINTEGATFKPTEDKYCYFLASDVMTLRKLGESYPYMLIAVNELRKNDHIEAVKSMCETAGVKLFLDSGIFWLTNEHARKTGIRMDQALALAPEQIPGFDELMERYLRMVDALRPHLWGYIELDQGGRENKIRTRAKLEGMGLKPIPVYHPLNDGWDYFDHLAQNYDRICFGNVVQAAVPVRKRLIATAWERQRKYPHLWIHLLGLTPNQWQYAMPISSADSSSWLSSVKWSGYRERAAGQGFSDLGPDYLYQLGSDPDSPAGHTKALRLAAYGQAMHVRSWRNHVRHLESLGFEAFPK